MISEKVLITYKRKRPSASANPANAKAEASSVKTEREHCFACGSVDVNDNLLVCRSCSGSYHLRCIESLSEYVPEERWLCSACAKRCGFQVSSQQESQTQKMVYNKIVGKSTTTLQRIHHQMLLHSSSFEDNPMVGKSFSVEPSTENTNADASLGNVDTEFGSVCRVVEQTSMSQSTNLDTGERPSSVNMNSQSGRNSVSRSSEDCVSLVASPGKMDGIMLKNDHPKGKWNTSWITFRRRVKNKPSVAAGPISRNWRAEDKQSSLVIGSGHEVGERCTCADSTALLEAAGSSQLPIIQQDMNVRELAGFEAKLARHGVADEHKKRFLQCPYDNSQNATPSQLSEHGLQYQLDESVRLPTSDAAKNPVLLHTSKLSEMVHTGTSKRDEKGNELVSEERGLVSGAEICCAAPDVSTDLTNSKSNKPPLDVAMSETIVESQSSSSQNIALVIVDEETDGRAKCLQWLEKLDKTMKESEEGINSSTCMENCKINCRLVTNESTSSLNPINSFAKVQLNQDTSKESMNPISRLQENLGMDNLTYGKQHDKCASKSSMYADFLGLSPPLDSEVHAVDDLGSLPLDLNDKETVERHTREPRQHNKVEVASVSREKLVYGNNLIGLQMSKESTLLGKFQRFHHEWSEEELDCLWIGVRRHGLNNWSSILRNPKLRFSESRTAEDLAEQWDSEQIKLLSGTLSQPVGPRLKFLAPHSISDTFCANKASGNLYNEKIVSSCMEFPTQRLETKLSLGGVYVQSENSARRNLTHLSDLSVRNPFAPKSYTSNAFIASNIIGSSNRRVGTRHHSAFKTRYSRYDCESSTSPQRSVENEVPEQRSANSTLPHWLKEVFTLSQRQSSLTLPSGVAILNSAGEPPFASQDSRGRGILKRKCMAYRENAIAVKMSENSVSIENPSLRKRFSLLPDLGLTSLKPTSTKRGSGLSDNLLDLNKTSSVPVGPSNLVVIDSDASSEETISDDQGSRR